MTVSLRERNKTAAMAQVRTVAFELMNAHGFDAVTVEQIAAASNVTPSTVYRYFGTKEALVLSTERPGRLVARLAKDSSKRSALEAFQRAANRVWGGDADALVEMGLVTANPALVEAFERQLLDQRAAVAQLFAARRGKKSAGTRDLALAAAAVAVLSTALVTWQSEGGGDKALAKILTRSYSALTG